MTINCKYDFGTHVKHIYSEFEGFVVGILARPSYTEYEIQPVTDDGANHRAAVWIEESLLRVID